MYSNRMTTTEIPARIRHLGVCGHAQTRNARRICRKAQLAAAATPTYTAGDTVVIAGEPVVLTHQGSFSGRRPARWGWYLDRPEPVYGARTFDTAAEAVADATAKISGPRCRCGDIATMTASLGPTCDNHYDRYAA